MKKTLVLVLAVVLGLGVLVACSSDEFGCGDICDMGKNLCDWGEDTTCADECAAVWDAAPETTRAVWEACFTQATSCDEFSACRNAAPVDGDEDGDEETAE